MSRKTRTWTTAAIAVLAAAACASPPPPAGAPVQTDMLMDGMSDDASVEISDDVVTYQEYRNAFERFRQCLVDSGETLTGVSFDRLSGKVNYGVSTGDDICYDREFYAADVAWQLDPNRPRSQEELDQIVLLRDCIADVGAVPVEATTQDDLFIQVNALGLDPMTCLFPPTTQP